MQSEPLQGDPRLQEINPGPPVATGYVDPCIVYLEATLKGEVPLLVACWARSSSEVRKPGRATCLTLEEVVVCKCTCYRTTTGKNGWRVSTRREKSLTLKHGLAEGSPEFSYFSLAMSEPPPVFDWAIRYLDLETDASLQKAIDSTSSPNSSRAPVIRQILEHAKLEWPSIAEILASKEMVKPRTTAKRRPSLVRRFLATVFRKKKQPVPA